MLLKTYKSLFLIAAFTSAISLQAATLESGRYSPTWYSSEAEAGYPLGKHIVRNCNGEEISGSLHTFAKYSLDFTKVNLIPGHQISFCYDLIDAHNQIIDAIQKAKPRIEFLADRIKHKEAMDCQRTEYMHLETSLEMWLKDLRILRASVEFQEEVRQIQIKNEITTRTKLLEEERYASTALEGKLMAAGVQSSINPEYRAHQAQWEQTKQVNCAQQ